MEVWWVGIYDAGDLIEAFVLAVADGTDVDDIVETWLAGNGADSTITHTKLKIADVSRDSADSPEITVTQLMDEFPVTAPPVVDSYTVRGGVWQYGVGDETIVVVPEDGDITWTPATPDNDSIISDESDLLGKLWAKLDLSSVAPALTLVVLADDPDWEDNIHWRKLATITAGAGLFDAITVKQHHCGSIEGLFSSQSAVSRLYGMSATGSSGTINFTYSEDSNDGLIDADEGDDVITVKRTGWYCITLTAYLKLLSSTGTLVDRASVQILNGVTELSRIELDVSLFGPTGGSDDTHIYDKRSITIDRKLDADAEISAYISDISGGATVSEAELSVKWITE
jgi:hypothetical protein